MLVEHCLKINVRLKMSRLMTVHTVLLLVTLLLHTVASATPTIKAPWGTIQGIAVEGDNGRKMDGYLAIPYAEPPVGNLRFEKPQPHRGPGEGQVFVADKLMPACPQNPTMIGSARKQSEDCLMLDVYSPPGSANSTTPLTVMVFIHGGGFTSGDASFCRSSKLVVDNNIILVSIQYRLGALGFLVSGDGVLPGNLGLWDQNLALQWVKKNIRAFGGDPDSITIFGESAGSMSVATQIFSPHSRGLFQRAILESGAPQDYARMDRAFDMKAVFKGFVDLFECQRETTQMIVLCLKEQSEADFANKSTKYAESSHLLSYYFPSIDGEFIPRDLRELAQDEQYIQENGIGDIDVLIGFNNQEGGIVVMMPVYLGMPEDTLYTSDFFINLADFCLDMFGLKKNLVMKKSLEFFYRGADAGTDNPVKLDSLTNMFGDCLMNAAILELTQHLANTPHSASRYLYVLDHDFEFNKQSLLQGSHHGDELWFLFDNQTMPEDSVFAMLNKSAATAEEQPLSNKFVKIFATFAKTGDPTSPVKDDLEGDWPQFTTENGAYLSIKMSPEVLYNMGPYKERAAFWLKLLTELNSLTAELPVPSPEEKTPTARDEL